MEEQLERPDYIFEVSWEVCNKVGGIHTVISTKALTLVNEWEDKVIMIGPDVWKGTGEHPEFKEDISLYPAWKAYAASKGLKIKIGRWKITGAPVVVLIDFTTFFSQRDEIFKDLWLKCKVDSLSGGWDYIEPALFGYAAGKLIESFYHCHLTFSDKIIAQFHEWLTGVGVHYLEQNVPQIGTVFTTHATTVGRSIAGNGLPLYSKFDTYDGDQEARNFNIVAKHSLEKISAMHADCFTTVSEITSRECHRFLQKDPDVITPNGFDDFIVPDAFFFEEKRMLARKKLLQIAQALTGQELPEDALLIIKSGRYEFRNKGIDLFIDALGELNQMPDLKKDVVAFIFIPAHHTGPKKDLLDRMDSNDFAHNGHKILTHHLQGTESDPIMNRIKQNQLDNDPNKKVKVIFAPVYLDGADGVFNMTYYDLLVGFDLSAFPSYYEPWGYTPLESIAFHIPTMTTTLTGFGMILDAHLNENAGQGSSNNIRQGLLVIERNDNNDRDVVHTIAATVKDYEMKNAEEIKTAREAAANLSLKALWKNYILYYKRAYTIALKRAAGRAELFAHAAKVQAIEFAPETVTKASVEPVWREMVVQLQLPESLKPLYKLARNLWWTWHPEAEELSKTIDERWWERYGHNPISMLETLSFAQIKRLEKNKDFMEKLRSIDKEFEEYINRPVKESPLIAYFCMEYGLCNSLKLYSGGLGILAGDYLKQASDSGINMVGIGLLYRNGYFRQGVSLHGEQIEQFDNQSFTSLPLNHVYDKDGEWFRVSLAFPGRTVYAKVWRVDVGRIPLYLLDTDVPQNRPEDRDITNLLYGGDWENRLKQELLLGIGGVRLLRKLGINPDVYHYNEGHPAFAGLERLLMLVQGENISFNEAMEAVRASTHFTTHTPVPAGHDTFSEDMLRAYLAFHCNLLNITWKRLMALGRIDENNQEEKFSMSLLAARLSEDINAVSKIHEKVTREMFSLLWKGYAEEELNIGHVTNGVHLPTWVSHEHRKLYETALNKKLTDNISDPKSWEAIKNIPDKTLWETHINRKKALIEEVKNHAKTKHGKFGYSLKLINALSEKTLIIGFARRFVTYKRAMLPFYNPGKLASIIQNSEQPVLFLFAGKAHPNDGLGKDIVKNIIEISKREEFEGRVLFIEDYDMDLAQYLTQGVDVWLNTPEPSKEASGTSGMKAALNGVLNFSVADGWWAEANTPDNGWTFPEPNLENNSTVQDELDAEAFYQILKDEIIPTYYDQDENNIPVKWISMVKNSISGIAPVYSTCRMITEYTTKYYNKIYVYNKEMKENHYEKAKQLSEWKQKVADEWDRIQVITTEVYDSTNKELPLGSELKPKITLDIDTLSENDIGVEIVFIEKRKNAEDFNKIVFTSPLTPIEKHNNQVTYQCKVPITRSGAYEYGFRVYPKNPLLISKLDFPLVKWA